MNIMLGFRAPSHGQSEGTLHVRWTEGPEAWSAGHLVLTYRDMLALDRGATASDIYTLVRAQSEGMRVTDLGAVDGSSRAHGEASVRWVTLPIPRQALAAMRRLALGAWRAQRAMLDALESEGAEFAARRAVEDVTVDLGPYVARWARDYGEGTGAVDTVLDDCTATMLDSARAMGGNLGAMLERLEAIARNQTRARWERAPLRLYRDSARLEDPCFTFRVAGLFGGLVNHAPPGAPGDWSIHT